jgi:PAS domain S-box-containing protein
MQTEENSPALYESLFHNHHTLMLLIEPGTGAIVDANPAACAFYGYSRQQFVSLNIADLYTLPEGEVREELRRADSGARHRFTFPHRLANGELRHVEVQSGPVDFGGRRLLFSVIQDITDRKRMEESLQQANELLEKRVRERTRELAVTIENLREEMDERMKAETALHTEIAERLRAMEALREQEQLLVHQSRQAAMGEMLGNIAHQWRQPLNTLGLLVQDLSLSFELGDYTKEQLNATVTKAMQVISHMSRTIDDFRHFFRPGKEKVEFLASRVVADTLSLIEGSFQTVDTGMDISVETTGERAIYGYPNEFSQVLINILLNARDALASRNPAAPRITIRIEEQAGRTVVTVRDNGGGIPEDIMDRIFDPYFTTKGPAKGTGLGLFMSKTIIEKNMGGSLRASNTDEGAEFRIEA